MHYVSFDAMRLDEIIGFKALSYRIGAWGKGIVGVRVKSICFGASSIIVTEAIVLLQ